MPDRRPKTAGRSDSGLPPSQREAHLCVESSSATTSVVATKVPLLLASSGTVRRARDDDGFVRIVTVRKVNCMNAPAQAGGSEDEHLLKASDVAKRLAVSLRTVWRLRDAGQLSPVLVGARMIRFRASDIDALIRDGLPNG